MIPMFLPSPPQGVWLLFNVIPIRAYALCILLGALIGLWLTIRRWKAWGGNSETIELVALIGLPVGILGARVYYVLTEWQRFFGPGANPLEALMIWKGGLGIYGGVTFGALAAYVIARRRGVSFPALADAFAPGILIAQGVGRLGNYFNQELFGQPTTLPWGLEIAPQFRPPGYESFATFHPTFLYEMLWNFSMAAVLLVLDRRYALGRGKLFVLYVMLYSFGRFWIETVRIDPVINLGGLRLHNYTAGIAFLIALGIFLWMLKNRPGRNTDVEPAAAADEAAAAEDKALPKAATAAAAEESSSQSGATSKGPPEPAD